MIVLLSYLSWSKVKIDGFHFQAPMLASFLLLTELALSYELVSVADQLAFLSNSLDVMNWASVPYARQNRPSSKGADPSIRFLMSSTSTHTLQKYLVSKWAWPIYHLGHLVSGSECISVTNTCI